ncbi:hypothetical protein [Azospirillum sp.]|uniref:hypothetical protein n=1 Tax=Azospirillum sp. TaxID=34012 RepID=UPI003D73AE8D
MKRTAITAVLVLGLAACAGTEVRDETPGLARGDIPKAVHTQTYVPGGSGSARSAERTETPAPAQRPETPPPRRRGSSSPPPSNTYTGVPVTPQPGTSTDRAVSDLKRDQARSDLDRMTNFPTPMTPEPWRQREIMNQQLELDRQELMRR